MKASAPWLPWPCLATALLLGPSTTSASDLPAQQLIGQQQTASARGHHGFARLNFSSTAPLIFHSTFALLQQWPNTFFPNGHTIAPCTIPKNTHLYHAHEDASFPDSPEWLAFDSAMAYTIMAANPEPHLLTYRTTRHVKCIYFDGTSATLMGEGSMDSQMLVIHNNSHNIPDNPWGRRPPPGRPGGDHPNPDPGHGDGNGDGPPRAPGRRFNPLQAEYDRATALCNLIKDQNLGGLGWGYEGIVRMNAAFELIWCNFTSPSAELLSWINVSVPALEGIKEPWERDSLELEVAMLRDRPPRRGGPRVPFHTQPFLQRSGYEWFHAAAKTYGFVAGNPGPGEDRVKIDSCGLFTFYDPELKHQSLARAEAESKLLNLTSDGFWMPPSDSHERKAALQELGRRRRYQRATNVSTSDGQYMRRQVEIRLRDVLSQEDKSTSCSGVDWHSITRTVVTDYSPELLDLRNLLSNDTNLSNATDVRRWLFFLRGATHNLFMPFYEYPPLPIASEDITSAFSLSAPQSMAALDRCRNQHTPNPATNLTASELLTATSIVEVVSGICTTLLPTFLSMETIWLSHFNDVRTYPSNSTLPTSLQHSLSEASTYHLERLEVLMAWLGWTEQWTGCSPACDVGQVCAIPIWPVMGIGHFSDGKQSEGEEAPCVWDTCLPPPLRFLGPFGRDPRDSEDELWGGAKCVDAENAYGGSPWDSS